MQLFPFVLFTMFIFPAASIVLGIIGYYSFKNIYIMPVLIAALSFTAAFTVFQPTFWFSAALYTLLALLAGLFVKLIYLAKMR